PGCSLERQQHWWLPEAWCWHCHARRLR
ncbi:hypothetical protein BN1708_019802, partial [Verticillium longisporum]